MSAQKPRFIAFAILAFLLIPTMVFAQSSGAALAGRVTDDQGGGIPGVTVTATNNATGLQRVTVTDVSGSYRFGLLPVGAYTVTIELAGFSTATASNVDLDVARERNLDVTLRPAAVQESITVTAEAPLVSNTPAVGTTVSQQELENLPLNGRQFANLGSLAPGTSLSVNVDPTKPGQLTIALNGGSGRNVNYIVDGGDNTDDTIGGALQNFNIEAVQEFTIQTMQYKAEYGRSTGGVLTVVTKTGTNDFGGSVFGFLRDDSWNETTRTEEDAGLDAQPYERQTWGGSIGGPIVQDRAHYFATYEKTDRETQYVVDSGGIFPELDNQAFALPFEDELITAKATLDISARQLLQVRYGYQKNSDKYGAAPNYMPSSLGTVANQYESVLGGHTATISDTGLNEFIVQWTRFDNSITADSNDPNLYFPSGVQIGQNINTPQRTRQEKAQFKDDFSWSTTLGGRRHDWKTGFNYIHEPILGGDFTTGTSGQFNMLEDRLDSPVTAITVFGGFLGFETPVEQYGLYLQDDWSVSERLTVNAGLRYDFWDGFDLDQRSSPIWQGLSARSDLILPHLQELENGGGGVLENDDNNWAPRLGFTYDVSGDGRQLLRAGIGRFFDFPYTNATILFPSGVVQSDYGVIYSNVDANGIRNPDGSFFKPGDPLPPSQGTAPIGFREVASPTLATPYSDQISVGYSWQVGPNVGLTADVVSVRYRDLPYRFRMNPGTDANGDGNVTQDELLFPELNPRTRLWFGEGEADYDGINLGFRARVAQRLEMQGFYTWSQAEGNILVGADEFRLWEQPGTTTDVSVNPRDPQCDACFGPLFTDARHRVTLSGVYRAPWDVNVSGVLRYRSALPYTDHAGRDLNLDGYDMDLSPGVDHVNSRRGEDFSQFDVRLSKNFPFAGNYGVELIAELFNVFNEENPAGFVGNRQSSSFGEPTRFAGDPGMGEQRLFQFGVRVRY
jgi:outer membrane receptor protein involved in Fe transport